MWAWGSKWLLQSKQVPSTNIPNLLIPSRVSRRSLKTSYAKQSTLALQENAKSGAATGGQWGVKNGIPNFCKVNTGSMVIPFYRVNCRNMDCATKLSHIYNESMVGKAEAPFIAILDTRDGAQVRGLHNRNDATIKLLNQRFEIYARVMPKGVTGIAPRLTTNKLHGSLPGFENSLEAPRAFWGNIHSPEIILTKENKFYPSFPKIVLISDDSPQLMEYCTVIKPY